MRRKMNLWRHLKNLSNLTEDIEYNEDNFHLIAISNLNDPRRKAERYWEHKFKRPIKSFDDHTEEEIYIVMLEDYYEKHPVEIERFKASLLEEKWDGETDDEYEEEIRKRLKSVGEVDLSEYQDKGTVEEISLPKGDIDDDFTISKETLGSE